ncbi:hypothetical protein M2101_001630 [Parabacteroides sp. PM5-20]|nr:hypothetical protein [Parabacteroides sp. PM5-20]
MSFPFFLPSRHFNGELNRREIELLTIVGNCVDIYRQLCRQLSAQVPTAIDTFI